MEVEEELAGSLDDYICVPFRVNYFANLFEKMKERGRKGKRSTREGDFYHDTRAMHIPI